MDEDRRSKTTTTPPRPPPDSLSSHQQGPKAYDGVWAYHWYDSIHKTTGFDKPKASYEAFPDEAKDMLRAVMPFYTMLRREAIAGALPLHKCA